MDSRYELANLPYISNLVKSKVVLVVIGLKPPRYNLPAGWVQTSTSLAVGIQQTAKAEAIGV